MAFALVRAVIRRVRRGRRDRGALSIEFVILTPVILLMFALVYLYGRIEQVNGTLQAGTRDAVRAATQQSNEAAAKALAVQIITDEVGTHSSDCKKSVQDNIVFTGDWEPGGTVTVKATCTYSTGDIGLPFGGDLHASATFSSVLDPNRAVQ